MFPAHVTCAYLYSITRHGYPPPAEDTLRHLDEMAALGFQSVELEGIRDVHLTAMHAQRDVVAAHVRRLELEVPYFCVVLPGLSSPDADERACNLALFKLGCETAVALGARGVLDNAPLPPYQFPGDVPLVRHYEEDVLMAATLPRDLDWPTYWGDLTGTYRDACDVAAKAGLTYQMHPAMGVLAATPDAYLRFHDAVGRDNLRYNLDTANLIVLRENLALAVHRLAGHIDYVHLSDNGGHRVEHLPPGDGAIRWDVFFEALDATGFCGHIGLDIGGAETPIADLDQAYVDAAHWLTDQWPHPVSL